MFKYVNGEPVEMTDEEIATFLAEQAAQQKPRIILAGWFKAAISQMGKTAAVAAAVASQPEWKQILWNAATHIREDDADVIAIAAALNINLSAVFDKAEEIRASMRGEG